MVQDSPDSPEITPNTRNARQPMGYGNHSPWGVYTMIIDQETRTIEVIDNRQLALHLNVRNVLESDWWCPAHNCIKIQFIDIDDTNYIYTIKGTLVNPTYFTGFDVRVIIFYDEDKEHDLLNADDYTMLYEDGDFINPFRSYAKTVDQRTFGSFSSFSEIFELYVPPAPKKFLINFAIDASWPTNCEEPYDLENFGFEGSIYPDDPDLDGIDQGEGLIFTEVHDWQFNVSEVTIDTTPITGGITTLEYNSDTDRWEAPITDLLDAPPGDYTCLIAAFSEIEPSIGLYNYLTFQVDETPPPAVQTIFGHIGDSFFLDDLDGSVVSVVNQDPLGYIPEPCVVVSGQYEVDVATGVFNVTVEPADALHISTVCWDVNVTESEDVHLDLVMHDPAQIDPYDTFGEIVNYIQISGFAGRVLDDLGMPIEGATIEVASPDSWGAVSEGQDFVQAEITDEDGYFSILNIPMEIEDFLGSWFINNYHLVVRADGYEENDLGLFPALPGASTYQVVVMTPILDIPIWTEDFEDDTGWGITGYYHRQQYDPMIKNISFDPAYNMQVMAPDELIDGSIPAPAGGEYYMWYGREVDGNFLGPWDPLDQIPYGGGISIMAHEGYAMSPDIDLMAYTEARIEFDMCYDIESNIPSEFDMMRLYINIGGIDNPVRFFNTFVDPGPLPYPVSQRGYFRTPIWCHYSYDISSHTGNMVSIKFHFMTNDMMYNGGRGQFIDNIKVYAQ